MIYNAFSLTGEGLLAVTNTGFVYSEAKLRGAEVSTNVTMLLLNINTFNSPVNSPVKIQNPTRDF